MNLRNRLLEEICVSDLIVRESKHFEDNKHVRPDDSKY